MRPVCGEKASSKEGAGAAHPGIQRGHAPPPRCGNPQPLHRGSHTPGETRLPLTIEGTAEEQVRWCPGGTPERTHPQELAFLVPRGRYTQPAAHACCNEEQLGLRR
ncbi:hypothetical protein NDU88_003206 [Pleurodeles waltl]|uniref:Uncharacterized protein n=1 Tax=Pleurodeles waltl TaxID=8319 RepID=A0AAV7QB45_PLEWA|nr:hypothetical protein NDU88_003206 [Pleurodeles waltl]